MRLICLRLYTNCCQKYFPSPLICGHCLAGYFAVTLLFRVFKLSHDVTQIHCTLDLFLVASGSGLHARTHVTPLKTIESEYRIGGDDTFRRRNDKRQRCQLIAYDICTSSRGPAHLVAHFPLNIFSAHRDR